MAHKEPNKESSSRAGNHVSLGFDNHKLGTVIVGALTASDGISNPRIFSQEHTRNLLPEPFDFFDHAGNFTWSMITGFCVTGLAAWAIGKFDRSPNSTKAAAITVSTLAVAGVNALTETRWGTNFMNNSLHSNLQPSTIDLAYGIGAGLVASSIIDIEHT